MHIYFDHAATSWPKHPAVIKEMTRFMEYDAGNPGRSGHSMSVAAARIVFTARERLAHLFGSSSPDRVIFTKNATEALNMIIFGLLDQDCHVVTSSVEHNAVMRPLRFLESKGMGLSVVACSRTGIIDPEDIRKAVTAKTKLIMITHASNVCGAVQPIREIGRIARDLGLFFAVDAAQTAGCEPINIMNDHIDFLAFTGHKGLGGPQGTGGLVLAPGADLPPLLHGGTGSLSDNERQPGFLPDKLESGTLNAIGIAGLGEAVKPEILRQEESKNKKQSLLRLFMEGLAEIPGVLVYGPQEPSHNAGVISINIKGAVCSEIGLALDQRFGILTRTGLHCAPSAHRTIGTFPQGTVRFSLGAQNNQEEIEQALAAIRMIAIKCGELDE